MSSSKESTLDVLALAYDHFRILRDCADRAKEYLSRIQKRGRKSVEEEFWVDLPEPVNCLTIDDLINASEALTGDFVLKMGEVKEQASKIVEELKLTKHVDTILYDLVIAQQKKNKPKTTKDWLDNQDKMSPLNALQKLPLLGPNEQYDYDGDRTDGTAIWKIITLLPSEKPKEKPNLKLRRRPKS